MDELRAECLIQEVSGDADERAGGELLSQELGKILSIRLLLGEVVDGDSRALTSVRDRNRPANARVTAGDKGMSPLEPSVADVGLLAAVGSNLEVGMEDGVPEFGEGEVQMVEPGERVYELARAVCSSVS